MHTVKERPEEKQKKKIYIKRDRERDTERRRD